ncbi:MAG: hypothetical protein LM549_13875 [Candidatus Competibacter sp.]|nr:hypothetical protein [Candidatus Competibacter sp.]
MFESDDYRHGADQARNGITRHPPSGKMSRAEIQGYCDEIDRQQREKAQREEWFKPSTPINNDDNDIGGFIFLAIFVFILVYSYWRIIVVACLILVGVASLIYAIFRVPKDKWRIWLDAASIFAASIRKWIKRGFQFVWQWVARKRRQLLARIRGRRLPPPERLMGPPQNLENLGFEDQRNRKPV